MSDNFAWIIWIIWSYQLIVRAAPNAEKKHQKTESCHSNVGWVDRSQNGYDFKTILSHQVLQLQKGDNWDVLNDQHHDVIEFPLQLMNPATDTWECESGIPNKALSS